MNSLNNQSSSPIDRNPSFIKRVLARKAIGPVLIILIGVVVFIGMGAMAPEPLKKPIVSKSPLVDVLEVSRGVMTFEIESQGSISPRTETTLVSEVSGQIKSVSAKFVVGGFFKKGEQLLEIDPISYEVALLQAQARLDGSNASLVEEEARGKQAEKEWSLTGRSKKTAPILALRKPQLQQALANVKAAEADVKNAQIKLQRTRITAPYDAMLKVKIADVGQYVTTGSQLATTFAVDYAEIRLPIKEQDLAYIDVPAMGSINGKGSQVLLSTVQGSKLKRWSTYITRSEGVVDVSSRVNYVVAQINDPYGLLSGNKNSDPIRMGTFVKATIIGNESDSIIAIPRKAVHGENQIYLLDSNNKLDLTEVDIIRGDAKNIYISGGLDDGSKIVLTKLATAVEGMSLRLSGDKTTPESKDSSEIEADGSQYKESAVAAKKSINYESSEASKEDVSEKESDTKASVKEGGDL